MLITMFFIRHLMQLSDLENILSVGIICYELWKSYLNVFLLHTMENMLSVYICYLYIFILLVNIDEDAVLGIRYLFSHCSVVLHLLRFILLVNMDEDAVLGIRYLFSHCSVVLIFCDSYCWSTWMKMLY